MARIIQTAALSPTGKLSRNENHWIYNGLDTCVTMELAQKLPAQLDNTTRNTYEFSKDLQGPILEMSMRGLLRDERRCNR